MYGLGAVVKQGSAGCLVPLHHSDPAGRAPLPGPARPFPALHGFARWLSTHSNGRCAPLYPPLGNFAPAVSILQRIVRLGGPVDDDMANLIVAQLLYLDSADPNRDITLYINSPGGSVTAGAWLGMRAAAARFAAFCPFLFCPFFSFFFITQSKLRFHFRPKDKCGPDCRHGGV